MNEANNEDAVIAEGLKLVRKAIVEGDWQWAVEGYNLISGENLSIPDEKKKSRLENIREILKEDSNNKKQKKVKKQPKKAKENVVFKDKEEDGENPKEITAFSKTQKGGRKFGLGKIEIISDGFDPKVAEENAKLAKKKPKITKRIRVTMPRDNSNDPDADVRFYNRNTPPKG